jgi:hypothetical protein
LSHAVSYGNYIAAEIAVARRQSDLIKAGSIESPRDNLFPFFRWDTECLRLNRRFLLVLAGLALALRDGVRFLGCFVSANPALFMILMGLLAIRLYVQWTRSGREESAVDGGTVVVYRGNPPRASNAPDSAYNDCTVRQFIAL